jgi:hypothetical protein
MSAPEVLNPRALIPCKNSRAEANRKSRAEMEAERDKEGHEVTSKEATIYYVFFVCFYTSPETG